MDLPAWVIVVIVVAAVLLVAFVVLRRGNAGAETEVGGVGFKIWGSSSSSATITGSTSRTGGASAEASGDARIENTQVDKDLTARAGVQPEEPRQDPKAP